LDELKELMPFKGRERLESLVKEKVAPIRCDWAKEKGVGIEARNSRRTQREISRGGEGRQNPAEGLCSGRRKNIAAVI